MFKGIRTNGGCVYQRSSYVAARATIQQLTIWKRPFSIRCREDFQNSNRVLQAVLKKNKAEGKPDPFNTKKRCLPLTNSDLTCTFKTS